MPRTLADDMADDFERIWLNEDEFAQAVTRDPASGADVPVTAIWSEGQAERDTTTGERTVRTGLLLVSASVTVLSTDQWIINGETWQTDRFGGTSGGARTLHLRRDKKVTTREPSRVLL